MPCDQANAAQSKAFRAGFQAGFLAQALPAAHPQKAVEPTKKQTAAMKALKQNFGECKTKGKPPYSVSLSDANGWERVAKKPLSCPRAANGGEYRAANEMYYQVSCLS